MQLLVVGAGTMGRWFGRAVADPVSSITFADADAAVAERAADELGGTVRSEGDDSHVDVVCIAVPMPALESAIAEYAPLATEAVVDVTGVMAPALSAMADHGPDLERVSLHPLFAPSNEPGSVAVVSDQGGPVTDRLIDAIEQRGNTVFETTATEHDEAMKSVQAGTHAAVLAYALAAGDVREEFHTPISGPLTELAAAVTDGEPRVYADIQEAFDGADAVAAAAGEIADADRETFEELFEQAGENIARHDPERAER